MNANNKKDKKCTLLFTPEAYLKTHFIVQKYTTEVGWHGLVKRVDRTTFLIYDIIAYPHNPTAVTIPADDEEYTNWYAMLPDEIFDDLRMHGHSHVNMDCFPSGTDMRYRRNILAQLKPLAERDDKDVFYIFFINNKKGEITAVVYDISNNTTYYSGRHISINIQLPEGKMTRWLNEFAEYTTPNKEKEKTNNESD